MSSADQKVLSAFATAFVQDDLNRCLDLISRMNDVEAPGIVRLMAFICIQRAGHEEVVKSVAAQWEAVTFDSTFMRGLTRLLLGKASLESVLALASNDEERSEAHFLAAECAVTAGNPDEAVRLLEAGAKFSKKGQHLAEVAETRLAKLVTAGVLRAFMTGNYARAGELAVDSGKVLLEGVAVAILSMQRSGTMGPQAPKEHAEAPQQWHEAIMQLVVDRFPFERTLALAQTPQQQCFTRFCRGARLRTLRRDDEAKKLLQACLDMGVDCDGARLARAELQALAGWGN